MKKAIAIQCPHCNEENDLMWDVEKSGFEIRCMHCGKPIMLCCECNKRHGACDWGDTYKCCSMCKTTIEKEQKKLNVRQMAHERFKLWWMMTHGYTVKDLGDLAYQYVGELEDDYEGTLEEYIQMKGFSGGDIWPCPGEFVSNEYQDTTLMYEVLSAEEYQEYLEAEGFEEPDHLGDTIKVETPHGEIVAYDNNDPDYPGISLFFVPKGSDREGPGGVMEFTSNYSPDDHSESLTDMVWFRFYGKENPYDEPTNTFELE